MKILTFLLMVSAIVGCSVFIIVMLLLAINLISDGLLELHETWQQWKWKGNE